MEVLQELEARLTGAGTASTEASEIKYGQAVKAQLEAEVAFSKAVKAKAEAQAAMAEPKAPKAEAAARVTIANATAWAAITSTEAQAVQEMSDRLNGTAMCQVSMAPREQPAYDTTPSAPGLVGVWDISEGTIRNSLLHYKRVGKAFATAQQARKRVSRLRMRRHATGGEVKGGEVAAQNIERPWFRVLEGGRPWKIVFKQAQDIAMRHASWCVCRAMSFYPPHSA